MGNVEKNMQQFRIASEIEEDEIFSLYDAVKAKGKIDGSSDWDEDYPNREILKDDLKNRSLYVLEDNNKSGVSTSVRYLLQLVVWRWETRPRGLHKGQTQYSPLVAEGDRTASRGFVMFAG